MKSLRKLVCLFLIFALAVSPMCAAQGQNGEIKVKVNGKQLAFEVSPVILQEKTMVPLRAIFEALGAMVQWDGSTKTVTGAKGNRKMKLQIDNKMAKVNGQDVELEVAATLIDGNTMVPVRFIAESLGATVGWEDSTRTVLITLSSETPSTETSHGVLYQSTGDIEFSITTSRLVDTYFIVAGLYYDFNHSEVMPYTSERELYRKAKEYFLPYKNHVAVREFSKFNAEMYAYTYLLNFSDLPDALKIHQSKPGNPSYDTMVDLLKQFYTDTKAEEFFKANQAIFDSLKTYVKNEAPKSKVEDLIREVEAYTGNKAKYFKKPVAYTSNITLFKFGAPFTRLEDPDKYIFGTVAPAFKYTRGSDAFDISKIIEVAAHEFLHQYVNPPVAANKDLINQLTATLKREDYVSPTYIQKDMPWYRLTDENIVRAVEARLFDKIYGGKRGYTDIIEKEIRSGFKNVGKAYVKLDEYEKNRVKYPTIDDFIPELIEALYK